MQRLICDLKKIFPTSKFSFFFPTSPIKLDLGLEIGEKLLIINFVDQSLWWSIGNREQQLDDSS